MSQTLEQYLRDELANSGAIDFSLRASVSDGSVRFYIHPTNRAGMTVDFEIKGNTLIPPGGLYVDAVRPTPPAPLLGEDGALLVEPVSA
jgi:hypothetical protein